MAKLGDRIDRFTLVRQLGAGGMGETWEAVRQSSHEFEQRVAIKLADPEVLETSDGIDSFRREAALAASLRHPNIAAVLDVDERAGYIVCELVDGADLRAVLRAAPGGKLDAVMTVHVLGQIARGLSHAHRRILRGRSSPVIHRDMSPGNVVIDYDGNVKIVDFGIAKAMIGGADVAESIKGKLAYMAPEQAMGGRMDGRVDQYALGVIAYEMLTGVRPNDGAHEGETLSFILGGKHVPIAQRLPALPSALAGVIERMLALRPEQRFGSMDAVLDALSVLTPPLTTHRSLIPLVIAARQPHTIVQENGRFISRPVEVGPILLGLAAASGTGVADAIDMPARAGRRIHGVSTPAALPASLSSGSARHDSGRGRAAGSARRSPPPLNGGAPALAATLGSTEPSGPSSPQPFERHARSRAERRERQRERESPRLHEPASSPRAKVGASSHAAADSGRRRARAPRSPIERLFASRSFWQGLTALGAALLLFVAWVAFSPEALWLLASSPAAEGGIALRSPAAPGDQRGQGPAVISTTSVVRPPPAAAAEAAQPQLAGAAQQTQTVVATGPEAVTAAAQAPSVGAASGDGQLRPVNLAPAALQPTAAIGALEVAAGSQLTAASADGPLRAGDTPATALPPTAAAAEGPAAPGTINARLRVTPWGRVWIDRELRGVAKPTLELALAPGRHVIAVGRDAPLQTRLLEIKPGASESIDFELEPEP